MRTRIVKENVRGGIFFVDYLSSDGKCWKNYSSSKSYDDALKLQQDLRAKQW